MKTVHPFLLQDLLEPLSTLSVWLQREDATMSEVSAMTKVTLAQLDILKKEYVF